MDAFPAYFPLAGRKVVIAGSGEPAEAKARLFAGSPANVVRLEGQPALSPQAYIGARLVFVADHDGAFVVRAVEAARQAGALVNVADHPDLCDFTTPAVIDRGEVVAAVGTGGASPMLATLLRHDIESQVPEGTGRVALLFRKFQDEVRQAFPELHRRRAFLRAALLGPAAERAMGGDMEAAADLFRQALRAGAPGLGLVQFVDGRGPVDLLTLRAGRALAAADVLVADPEADPAVLALARRDAPRLAVRAGGPAKWAELAREGKRIVRVHLEPPELEVATLARAGVAVETLAAVR